MITDNDLELVPDLDLGSDHFLRFTKWAPDDLPGNRQWLGIPEGPLPVVEKYGAIVWHLTSDGKRCEGAITFRNEWSVKHTDGHALWDVESWEPLTVHPSLACQLCGDHGFIRDGKWIKA